MLLYLGSSDGHGDHSTRLFGSHKGLYDCWPAVILSAVLSVMLLSIYADNTTPYCKCDQVSDLWQQLELASEL